jgi:protein TonB
MPQVEQDRNRDRLKAAVGVAAFHAALGYALITGLGYEVVSKIGDNLKVFDVPEPVPPPVEEPPPPQPKAEKAEGEASPPNLVSKASPVVAPQPKIRLEVPPPVVAAPVPKQGNDRSAGSANVPGPGTGSGGVGDGSGSGGQGTGTGGGIASSAERESGQLSGDRDYPRAARAAGIEGSVAVRFTVEPSGRVSGCQVLRSSANAELDSTTCRLIEQRFRYRPARDGAGNPVPEVISRTFDWMLPRRR